MSVTSSVLSNDGERQINDFVVKFVASFVPPDAVSSTNNPSEESATNHPAAAEFQKTVDNYTQVAQVSEALLKIGLCRRALGDVAGARAAWELVTKQFPKSDAARQARALLASKTGGGR